MAKQKIKKVAVIGAGPAGITAAYELSKKGVVVDLYEASPFVGGMARSIKLWGQIVDIGPHRFFSSDTRVNKLWLEVIGKDYQMVNRLTRIYFKGKFYHYPIKAFDALKNLGIIESIRCVLSYIWQKTKTKKDTEDSTFEDWVISRFGRRLYQHFFKTYSEKLWGIPCTDLDADFAAQRIKKLSLYEAIKNAVFGGGSEKHKTLIDQFAYPNHGTGEVYERMKTRIESDGNRVLLNTPVDRLLVDGKKVTGIKLTNGEELNYDEVISSMPLTLLVSRIPSLPKEVARANQALRFRNTVLVYLKVNARKVFPDNWIYVHSSELRTGRITNFRNWVPTILKGKKESILAMEYWCFDEDDFWHWDDKDYIKLAKEEIVKTGLVEESTVATGKVVRIPRCYPVYKRGYKRPMKIIENFLRSYSGIQVIGRYGAFKYNNQDHSILMGLLAAQNITDKADNDLWSINTDYDYQESSVITKTGLVEK
jgi:protoporphyrinogen oxidase